jgi:DNA-binding CsgD family transcriptional regulator
MKARVYRLTERSDRRRDDATFDSEVRVVTASPEVPAALRQATRAVSAIRGRALQLHRLFNRSLIPMLMVDNERRYIEVNPAARLFFRMSLQELRQRRIDDLTADWPEMIARWEDLMEQGTLSDRHCLTLKDGSSLCIFYAAQANALPGHHLIVFVPADWPGDELDELQPGAGGDELLSSLSGRQREVLRLVAMGANASQIAAELSISEATVRTHVKNILGRLGVHNRAHAVALAMTQGLLGETEAPIPAETSD